MGSTSTKLNSRSSPSELTPSNEQWICHNILVTMALVDCDHCSSVGSDFPESPYILFMETENDGPKSIANKCCSAAWSFPKTRWFRKSVLHSVFNVAWWIGPFRKFLVWKAFHLCGSLHFLHLKHICCYFLNTVNSSDIVARDVVSSFFLHQINAAISMIPQR